MDLICDEEMVDVISEPLIFLPMTEFDIDLIDDWYTTMLHQERNVLLYNPTLHYVQTRHLLVQWTSDVGEALNIEQWIVHAAIVYLDRILSNGEHPPTSQMQLYCLCSLYIAAKFFALDADIPSLEEVHAYGCGLYTIEDIKKCEGCILHLLQWSLSALHPLQFVRFFVASTPLYNDDMMHDLQIQPTSQILESYRQQVECLAQMCMLEYSFQQYLPSIVATSIIAAGRRIMDISPIWRQELEELTGYCGNAIEACFNHVWHHYVSNYPSKQQMSLDTSPTAVSDI
ncbi:hypothetical protein THRCLA_01471 [Thraustotheca clavata]|uniref:Cyclin-like domain-containing protein n=1 Tax=Thraustotheca clavata TaxID=74557 RepID=A0A1W0A8F7_9STRA|nr:hypothetical protein THRCLA_01471 [Thraustotheca clavata]